MIGGFALLPGFENPLLWILGVPLGSAGFLAVLKDWRVAAWVNVLASGVTFASSLVLIKVRPEPTRLLFIDDFNVYLVVLTAFIGLTTAVFSAAYIARESEAQRLSDLHLRFYHAMYQAFLFTMRLALCANKTGVMWVAVEAATLTTVLMVSLYRTREAIEAAWKYFILCSVGIGLALFGTTLVYLAAQPVMGDGADAMAWTLMIKQAHRFQPDLLNLAFVFVLVGYGTKVGLAPLHAWLPDAHAEGPTPISAVLSGLLLNVALYALLRFKMVIAANGSTLTPGPLLIVMGLSSLFLSAFMLYRRGDIKRLFAYSSIEHMGVITFAFGMGGAVANFAAFAANPRFTFLHANICDKAAVANAFATYKPDFVFHLAAESHVDRSIDSAGDFIMTNVLGTQVLLDAARSAWAVRPVYRLPLQHQLLGRLSTAQTSALLS